MVAPVGEVDHVVRFRKYRIQHTFENGFRLFYAVDDQLMIGDPEIDIVTGNLNTLPLEGVHDLIVDRLTLDADGIGQVFGPVRLQGLRFIRLRVRLPLHRRQARIGGRVDIQRGRQPVKRACCLLQGLKRIRSRQIEVVCNSLRVWYGLFLWCVGLVNELIINIILSGVAWLPVSLAP